MNFKCKLSTKCRLKEFVKVFETVYDKEKNEGDWFKETQFGHLIEVPTYLDMNLTPLWMMLCRRIQSKKEMEVWFLVNGKLIRFSMIEYALISGLPCSKYPEGWKKIGTNSFREKHFEKKKVISYRDVRDRLLELSDFSEEGQSPKKKLSAAARKKRAAALQLEKKKMTVLLFISSVLAHPEKDSAHIGDGILRMVDDLDFCLKFPWGTFSFFYLMDNLHRMDLEGKSSAVFDNKAEQATCNLPGFILPLTVSFIKKLMFIYLLCG